MLKTIIVLKHIIYKCRDEIGTVQDKKDLIWCYNKSIFLAFIVAVAPMLCYCTVGDKSIIINFLYVDKKL